MDTPFLPASPAVVRSAVGLVIKESGSDRLCMLAMLCAAATPMARPTGLFVPPQALDWQLGKAVRQAQRFVEPIVGELFHFAQGLSGGIAVRSNEWATDPELPTMVISKIVDSKGWDENLARAKRWLECSHGALDRYVKNVEWAESRLVDAPGTVNDVALESFRRMALDLARRSVDETPAEAPSSRAKPRM